MAKNKAHNSFHNCLVDHVGVKNYFHMKFSLSNKLIPYPRLKKLRRKEEEKQKQIRKLKNQKLKISVEIPNNNAKFGLCHFNQIKMFK